MSKPQLVTWTHRASRAAFALSFGLLMTSPVLSDGLFDRLPIFSLELAGRQFRFGVLLLLPVLSAAAWIAALFLDPDARRSRWGPLHVALPVWGLGLLALVRTWPIHNPHTAITITTSLIIFLGTYVYVLHEYSGRWPAGLLAALLFLQGAVALTQFLRQGSVGLAWMGEGWLDPQGQGISVVEVAGRRWLRAYGLMPHPNVLGGYLSMYILACLGSIPRLPRWVWGALLVGGCGLFVTFSRSAWLGGLAGLLYMAAVAHPWRTVPFHTLLRRRAFVISAAIALVAVLTLAVAYRDLIVTRFFRLDTPLEATSIRERQIDFRQAWELIRTVPLQGVGSGYYIQALWAGVTGPRPPGFRQVHSVPLLAAAELGVGGAFLWSCLTLAPPIVLAWQARRGAAPIHVAGWAAALVAAFVIGLFDFYLYIPSVFWAAAHMGLFCGTWARLQGDGRRAEVTA